LLESGLFGWADPPAREHWAHFHFNVLVDPVIHWRRSIAPGVVEQRLAKIGSEVVANWGSPGPKWDEMAKIPRPT
jgi:hypothetical protein